MKLTMKFLALFFGVLILANVSYAQSPREQLNQMVEQLQKFPGDNALREKIIKLAQELKPPHAVPDAAVEFEGRAQFAFKNAKSNDDFLAAAREYEKAVVNAPWLLGYYSDLCTIYEKAGKFQDAKRNCEFYLIGLTDSEQITEVKRRIAGLKYGIEQNSPESIAARKQEERAKRGVAGLWQFQSSRNLYHAELGGVRTGAKWDDWTASRDRVGINLRLTFEFRKTGDSYDVVSLNAPDARYRTLRADETSIEFYTSDSCGYGSACEDKRLCNLEGEGLFCTQDIKIDGTLVVRSEERYARRESCAPVEERRRGLFQVRCR
jgi:hypothetical protein